MLEKKKIKEEGKSLVHIFTSAALQIRMEKNPFFFFQFTNAVFHT